MNFFTTAKLWTYSTELHGRGRRRTARLLKAWIYFLHKAVLAPEVKIGEGLELGHYGHGVTVHPNVVIGKNVRIWQGVTLAVSAPPGHSARLVLEDNVTIGAGAVVITPFEAGLTIGHGSVIAANAVVTRDVPPNSVVAGNPGRVLHSTGEGKSERFR